MPRTQAIFYRDENGSEPVGEFIEALPGKRAVKIDDFIDEHLNGHPVGMPPPDFPVSSQIEGELRELGAIRPYPLSNPLPEVRQPDRPGSCLREEPGSCAHCG
jgi:hypothetical protein